MKTNNKVKFLLQNGISENTILKMNAGQINLLVERFKKETKEQTKVEKYVYNPQDPKQKEALNNMLKNPDMLKGKNIEIAEENEEDSVTSQNVFSKYVSQDYTGQEAPHDETSMQDDGMGDDSGENRSMMGMAESEINEKFESKAQQGLFWARCNKCSDKKCKWCKMAKEFSDSTSKKQYKNMPEKKHPEKTIKYKKKKTNEEIQKIWENEILEMLEKEKKNKKNKSFILRKPKKMTMFSKEAPIKLPIGKMFSIGKN